MDSKFSDDTTKWVRLLGHHFFVAALQQAVQLARRLRLGQFNQRVGVQAIVGFSFDDDVRALVVRAVARNLLGTRAQAGHRYRHLQPVTVVAVLQAAVQAYLIVQQANHTRRRRRLVAEVGEAQPDAGAVAFQPRCRGTHQRLEALGVQRGLLLVHQRHKARHVGAFLRGG